MMPENDIDSQPSDLDHALTAAEHDTWASLLDPIQQIKPSKEFGNALEQRLIEMGRSDARLAGRAVSVPAIPPAKVPSARRGSLLSRGNFRLALVGVALSAAMVILFVVATLMKDRPRTQSSLVADYLSAGKVHHLVIQHTAWATGPSPLVPPEAEVPFTTTQDVWLANGKNHVVMYTAFLPVPADGFQGARMWVTDDAVYDYTPTAGSTAGTPGYVLKYPYNPSYPNRYLPDLNTINDWSTYQANRVVGHGTLDGRPVIEIETDESAVPTPAGPSDRDKTQIETVDHVWLDTQTFQMVKLNRQGRYVRGPSSGKTEIHQYHLLKDEILERTALPADFFDFKAPDGAPVVDSADPIANPLLTPTSLPTIP